METKYLMYGMLCSGSRWTSVPQYVVQWVTMDICTTICCAVGHDGHLYHNTERQMSNIKAVMLGIHVTWNVTHYQLFLTFQRNVAFILKDPSTLALYFCTMSVATHPATQPHFLWDSNSHSLCSGTLTLTAVNDTCALWNDQQVNNWIARAHTHTQLL